MHTIYTFWTGDNHMSKDRVFCLEKLKQITMCNVILVDKTNLHNFILKDHPLHESYQFLSETHRADYLRTYFMHFYGGGYCDIKVTTGSWIESFEELMNSDKWINGYRERDEGCIAYTPYCEYYRELIGNGAYICKPQTPLTQEWYSEMISLMDKKLEQLIEYPASFPQDCAEVSNGRYPIEWNEMLGRIFHRVCYEYKDKLLNTLPHLYFVNYR
jgi:hypothetical protein